ncbi:protein jim lovell-like isoform X5 [Penaeus chinensis]|uniref:protein jim lovell-like isoform X5 n=1 Tax=Penaeus chinensis TaxID=139456 RepID=UPI001FB5B6FE|nr:protein jim lovell-like isoform X5 [Penaeus chinensis]
MVVRSRMGEGMLSLSWNNHSSTFCHMLSSLREKERYTDVTVTCEGKFYPVHKLVLSTCSDYFMKMFERTPCKHPIIVLKDIHCKEIEALLSYMYDGVVSVAQNDLSQLIKAAELLQIKGLAVPDEPPSSSRKAQNARNSADGRISPNPKRHKRDQGEVQNIFQSSPKSPFHQEKDQTQDASLSPRLPNKSEQAGDKDKTMASEGQKYQACPRQEQVEDAYHNQEISLHDNQGVEQHHIIKDSPNSDSEIMVDETLIKEEILDSSNESDIPDPALDYNSLGPDLGPDSGGGMEDNMNLDLAASFDHSDGHAYDSEAGPSGLQGWSVLNESGQGSAQDYCTEMNQDVSLVGQYRPLPQEQQQQHDLVATRSFGTTEERHIAGTSITGRSEGVSTQSQQRYLQPQMSVLLLHFPYAVFASATHSDTHRREALHLPLLSFPLRQKLQPQDTPAYPLYAKKECFETHEQSYEGHNEAK